MSSDRNFFKENAFGEMYEGTFFAEDFPKKPPESTVKNTAEAAALSAATNQVRLSNEVDASQEATRALSSAFDVGGNLGSMNNNFGGRIFGI